MYELNQAQDAYDKQEKRVFKLSLLMVKNTKTLRSFLETFEETRKKLIETEEFLKYSKIRQQVINEHRIPKGNEFETTIANGQRVFKLDRMEELEEKIKVLEAENKEVVEANENAIKEVEKSMDEKHEINLACITDEKQVEALELKTLVILAPIIKIKLSDKVLSDDVASSLTTSDISRLEKYCELV